MSYFWVDGSYDNFDNIRSTLYLNAKEKRSVLIGAEWHQEWSDSKNGIIDDVNMQSLFFGHAFKLYGWKEINNKPYLVAQLSNGKGFGDNGLFYFSRNVINSLAFRYGAITFRDFDPELYKKIEWTILQILANYIAILKKMIEGLIAKKQKPIEEIPMPPEPIKISKLRDWAMAIEAEESSKPPKSTDRNKRNNSPGNLRASELIQGFNGYLTKDIDNFAIFKNYECGFNALCKFLTMAAEDNLIPYHGARTLYKFTKIYAEPPNDNYAKNVANALKVNINVDISTLL